MRQATAAIATVVAAGMAFLAGCGAAEKPWPVEYDSPAAAAYDRTFRVARRVLRGYHFRIDREDRREGLIRTYPMTGQSWFEFWRRDAATTSDLMESSLQTIYRQAIVEVSEADTGGYDVDVRVEVARADRLHASITNTSQGFHMFSLERGRRQYDTGYGRTVFYRPPVPLPDDETLAARIAEDIEKALAAP